MCHVGTQREDLTKEKSHTELQQPSVSELVVDCPEKLSVDLALVLTMASEADGMIFVGLDPDATTPMPIPTATTF